MLGGSRYNSRFGLGVYGFPRGNVVCLSENAGSELNFLKEKRDITVHGLDVSVVRVYDCTMVRTIQKA